MDGLRTNGILSAALILSLAFALNARAQDKVRVGLSSISGTSGSIWVAEEKGLFKKHGIDPEVIIIGGGGARVIGSLLAGDIQYSVGGGEGSIRAGLKGADVVIIASSLTKGLQRLIARPDIKSYRDLKGKKVGITRFGSASHLALQLMLKKWNMRPEDVETLQVGSSPAMMASLEKGGIDSAVLTMPSFFVAEERGYRVMEIRRRWTSSISRTHLKARAASCAATASRPPDS
jgi:NitT/TauT family transport system substrate-binding protein